MTSSAEKQPNRRDFLFVATGAVAAVGGAAVIWPFVDQMNPDASVQALASIEVNLSAIEEGKRITVRWRGKPLFIDHRTEAAVEAARAVDIATLPDPQADSERVKEGHEQWLIMVGVCTHLGCVPSGQATGDNLGEFGGWFCPCHGSHYDTSGRIRKGPAPANLPVPPYEFVSDTTVRVG